MLSPLQERVAEIVAGLEEADGFALAGGAALIARGDVQRQTRDLDSSASPAMQSTGSSPQPNEHSATLAWSSSASRSTPASPA